MTTYSFFFASARRLLDKLEQELTSPDALNSDHEVIESLVGERGNELMRQLLQGHLDFRAASETRTSTQGQDGVERSQSRSSSRALMTLFGPTLVSRLSFRAAGSSGGLRPLDAELNLPPRLYSAGLQLRLVHEVAYGSYDHAVQRLDATTGGHVPKRQAEELVAHVAQDFDAFYTQRPLAPMKGDLMVLSFDGKGVVMRPEGLTDATRKRAEKGRRLRHRVSPGEKPSRKRMAQVATVYELKTVARTPEGIVGLEKGPSRPRAQDKRVWATLTTDRRQVVEDAFHEAVLRDEALTHSWVVLVDGDPAQLRYVAESAASYGVEPFVILDVIHVIERLWTAAWCLHDKGDPAAEQWVSERLLRLLRGQASLLAGAMRRSATRRGLSKNARKGIDQCASYLLKYKHLMCYDLALQRGFPIATGVIEGACRHLIKDRMDFTGARWGLQGAEAVLRLRSLASSGDLDEYWAFHRLRERERNHLSLYADTELSHLREAA